MGLSATALRDRTPALLPPELPGAGGTLYESVARRIAGLIARGTFRAGDRIPSVRDLSRKARCSITTVLEAYRSLEDAGYIEARPQSGYYVKSRLLPAPAEPAPSAPESAPFQVKVDELVMRVLRQLGDRSVIQLGAATPAPELLPSDKLHRALSAAARRLHERGNSYTPPAGLEALRVPIARRALGAGCDLAPDDIIVTCGAQEAVSLSLRAVCRPGDAVAIESPTYFGTLQTIEVLGLRAVEVPTHPRDGMEVAALRRTLGRIPIRACVLSANFGNPLGGAMPDAKKRALVSLLAEASVPLVEDDICGDLPFGYERPRAAKAYDRKGLVLYCSSFSKTLAPGYRVGWVAPGRFRQEVERLKFVTNIATATLPQHAIAEILRNGGYDRHLRRIRRVYARQVALMTEAVGRYFPEGTRVTRPQGGFVLWVEMPARADALALYEKAMARGISFVPGPLFSARKRFRNCMRLNAAYWSPAVEQALMTLGRLAVESL